MSVVPGGAQCYPGLSVMREWSCLPPVAPAVPQLPPAQSSALELESQRLGSQRFIIAHKAACLKVEALSHRGAGPQQAHCGHADPTHSHITEADGNRVRERGTEKKYLKNWMRKLPFQTATLKRKKKPHSSSRKEFVRRVCWTKLFLASSVCQCGGEKAEREFKEAEQGERHVEAEPSDDETLRKRNNQVCKADISCRNYFRTSHRIIDLLQFWMQSMGNVEHRNINLLIKIATKKSINISALYL